MKTGLQRIQMNSVLSTLKTTVYNKIMRFIFVINIYQVKFYLVSREGGLLKPATANFTSLQ